MIDPGRRKRILFVCTANQNRSRTAEDLYREDPRCEVRSAGTDVYQGDPEESPVTAELLDWADLVMVMERYHRRALEERFPGRAKNVVVLNIQDLYYRGDPVLIAILRRRVSPHLA